MPRFPSGALLLLLAAGAAAARSAPVIGATAAGAQNSRPPPAWYGTAAAALEARGDARSLAAAALLIKGAAPEAPDAAAHALRLAARAADADAGNHLLGWLRLRLCEQAPGCDVLETAASMRWLDPDNAAAWLSALAHAVNDHDEQATEHALAGMAQGGQLRYYWNPAIVMTLDALRAATVADRHAPSASAQLATIMSLTAPALIPNTKPLLDTCTPASQPQRRELCLRIAGLMQHADTVAAQVSGYALQRRLAAADSAAAHGALEQRRALEARVQREAKFETAFLPWFRNRIAAHRVELMRRHEREEDCINAVLLEHHVEI